MPAPVVRPAASPDLGTLAEYDRHIRLSRLSSAIADGRILLLETDGKFAGWLRWNLFWDSIPFLNLLFLLEPYRRLGFGSRLVADWEARMAADGFSSVMTSTQADEDAQHFYRKLGYADCGCLFPHGQTVAELFLQKQLQTGGKSAGTAK